MDWVIGSSGTGGAAVIGSSGAGGAAVIGSSGAGGAAVILSHSAETSLLVLRFFLVLRFSSDSTACSENALFLHFWQSCFRTQIRLWEILKPYSKVNCIDKF